MKLLTISSLYPNNMEKNFGVFVATRLRNLRSRFTYIESTVIAPIPWFPFKNKIFNKSSNSAPIDFIENQDGITVYHPRYLAIPKLGLLLNPLFMAFSLWHTIRYLHKHGHKFDVIDGHYFYPDGVAIALVAKYFKYPFTITARGSDINLFSKYYLPQKMIRWAAKEASHCISVCQALKNSLKELGVKDSHISVMSNGVDLKLFSLIADRNELRKKMSINGMTLISVGNLIELKGHKILIEVLSFLEDANLLIIGKGPLKRSLVELATSLGVNDRVKFLGSLPPQEVANYFNVADFSLLASSREGWANVLLESMACGTRVIATKVGGTPEVVCGEEAGILVDRNVQQFVDAIRKLSNKPIERSLTRKYAEAFSWDATSYKQYQLFTRLQEVHK